LSFGTRRKKIAGEDDDNFSLFMIFSDSVCQWVGPLEDCQKKKKTFFLPTIVFPGIGSSAKGKGLRRIDVEGIERSAEVFFFPISDVTSF